MKRRYFPSADHIGSSSVRRPTGFVLASRVGTAFAFAGTSHSERCSCPNGASPKLGPAETARRLPEHTGAFQLVEVPSGSTVTDFQDGGEASAIPSPIVTDRPA